MGFKYTVSVIISPIRTIREILTTTFSYICLGQLTDCIPTFALLLMFGLHVVVRKEKLTAEV